MGAPQIAALEPAAIIFSPGPGGPETTGVSLPLIKLLAGHVPMLGVCLGHLAMAAAFGGTIGRAEEPMHGKTSPVKHKATALYLTGWKIHLTPDATMRLSSRICRHV